LASPPTLKFSISTSERAASFLTMRRPSSVSKSASIERLPRLVEWK
jgi:hypothetical protein